MKRYCFVAIVFFLWCNSSQAQTWNLVWSDEFTGPNINPKNWTYDTGSGGWGNSELEYYTNRAANATISKGNLLIIGKKESYGGSSYTSARMKTEGLQSWTYGKIEARIKLPNGGQGLWPALWMLGDTISKVGWPQCGELDILETINSIPTVYGTAHWYNGGTTSSGSDTACKSLTGYHLYTIIWDSNSIKWLLDSMQYYEVNISKSINNTQAFHTPYKDFILLNMAIGGSWPGNPNTSTVFPDTMFVDYVRVYQLKYPTAVSIISNQENNTALYPQPSNGNFTISLKGMNGTSQFILLNMLGQTAYQKTIISSNTEINLKGQLVAGMYLYKMLSEKGEYLGSGKLIIKN